MKDMNSKQFLWQGEQRNVVMERKLNGFIHKEKDKTENEEKRVWLRKVDMQEVMMYKAVTKYTLTWMTNKLGRKKGSNHDMA